MRNTEQLGMIRELALSLLEEVESLAESQADFRARDEGAEAESGFQEMIEAYEKFLIRRALLRARGNQAQAARMLRLKPTTLHYKIKLYDIKVEPKAIECGGAVAAGRPDACPRPQGAR